MNDDTPDGSDPVQDDHRKLLERFDAWGIRAVPVPRDLIDWMMRNPDASPEEITRALDRCVRRGEARGPETERD